MGHLSLTTALAVWVLGFPFPRPETPPAAPVRQLSKSDGEFETKKYKEAVEFGRKGKWGHDEAQAPIREILDLCTRELGKDHYQTEYYRREIELLKKLANRPEADRLEYMKAYVLADKMNEDEKKGNYVDALNSAEEIVKIYHRQLGPGSYYEALVLNRRGLLYRELEHYSQAVEQFRDALKIYHNSVGEYHPRTIETYLYLGPTLARQFEFVEAGRASKRALDNSQRLLGDAHWMTSVARNNLAGHFERQARFKEAEELYRQALDTLIAAVGEDGPGVAMARNNLGVTLNSQGKYAAADTEYRRALTAQRKLGLENDRDLALFCGNLATNLDDQSRHTAAEHLHRTTVDTWIRVLGESHTRVAEARNNLAVNLDNLGKYAEAEEQFDKALQIYSTVYKGKPSLGAATVYSNLASCLGGQGRHAESQTAAEKAVAIYGDLLPADHPNLAAARNNMAASLKNQGKYTDAEPLFQNVLNAMKRRLGDDHPDTAHARTNLSIILYYLGRSADAEPHLRTALESSRRGLGEGHTRTAWTYKHVIGNACARGDYAGAEALANAAIDSFEAARLRLGFAGLDRALRTSDISPFLGLAVVAARRRTPEVAWKALERNMARGLLDHVTTQALLPEERKRELELLEKVNLLDRQLDELRARTPQTDQVRQAAKKAEADRDVVQVELAQFQAGMIAKHGVTAGRVYQLADIQKQLPDDAALVAWVDLPHVPKWHDPRGDHWACLVKSTGDPVWVQLRGTGTDGAWTKDDDRLAARFRDAVIKQDPKKDWRGLKEKLIRQRLQPLKDDLKGVQHLIVLPSADMGGIPVEALTDLTVSYAPSGTMFAWLREKRGAARAKPAPYLLAFGDPAFKKRDDGPADLPATRQELAGISRLFEETREFKGAEASEKNLDRVAAEEGGLRRYPYLHFATHGQNDDKWPMRSALLLAQHSETDPLKQVLDGKESTDGRITAERMLRRWKLDAELVTLSACKTGLGKDAGGDGYLGFSQALFVAGARSLVLSLWEVDDIATSLLMARFYENFMGVPEGRSGGPVAPRSKAEALKEAKQWLQGLRADEVDQLAKGLPRQGTRGPRGRVVKKAAAEKVALSYEHPYYWSGFVLVGDPR